MGGRAYRPRCLVRQNPPFPRQTPQNSTFDTRKSRCHYPAQCPQQVPISEQTSQHFRALPSKLPSKPPSKLSSTSKQNFEETSEDFRALPSTSEQTSEHSQDAVQSEFRALGPLGASLSLLAKRMEENQNTKNYSENSEDALHARNAYTWVFGACAIVLGGQVGCQMSAFKFASSP